MPRGVNVYDEARLQGRLWTPQMLPSGQSPHIWVSGDAPGNTIVSGNRFSGAQNLARGSSATITQGSSGARPFRDTTINGRFAIRFVNASLSALAVTGAAASNSGLVILYNDTSTAASVSAIGTANSGGETWHGGPDSSSWLSSDLSAAVARSAPTFFNGVAVDPVTTPRPQELTLVSSRLTSSHGVATTRIGQGAGATSRSITGVICEAMVWSVNIPTALTVQLCEGYMAWAWGHQNRMAADHPFRNRPPLIGD